MHSTNAQPGDPATRPTRATTILIVEDETSLARLVRDYLDRSGYRVIVAGDAASALQRFRMDRPDLVVLDLGLPDRDGLDVTREIRKTSNIPIIVLTARGDEIDRVVGLELGADDYMVKPFSPKELVARVRAVLRRTSAAPVVAEIIRAGDLTIDIPRMRVTRGDTTVELTPTEFQILAALTREPGRVLTRGQLLDAVHGVIFESYERAIDAHVKNIRRKLEPDTSHPTYVLTVHGVGYKFADAG
jgi:two-component system, OmpR family, alkaline phosphatase synthesis response regulator PhoP